MHSLERGGQPSRHPAGHARQARMFEAKERSGRVTLSSGGGSRNRSPQSFNLTRLLTFLLTVRQSLSATTHWNLRQEAVRVSSRDAYVRSELIKNIEKSRFTIMIYRW